MDHYLSTRCLFEGVLYYAIIGYTIALCTLSIQRLLIDNIENDINVALVVAHKRHICRSGLKRGNNKGVIFWYHLPRDALFRQLCVLYWLLDAMNIDSTLTMGSISECWKL